MVKFDRVKDIELCAEDIKANAKKIAEKFKYSRIIDITIHIEPKEPPAIILNHEFYPEGWIEGMGK